MARSGNNHKGGRPKGKKSQVTLEKEAVLKAFRERAMKAADVLFNAQLTLARGQTFLYKIEKEWVNTGKGGFYRKKKPRLVKNEFEIEQYLEGKINEGDPDDDQDPAATYYYLTAKEPNNMAIDSLMDRTFGKPAQSVDVTSGGKPLNSLKELPDEELQHITAGSSKGISSPGISTETSS